MNHKFAFVKYTDVFGKEHFEICNKEEYGINLVETTILFQDDDYNLVMAFKDEYIKINK
jgi:hypothetical protein